jgi:signal transduction histidine kinase
LALTVQDNGVGFDLEQMQRANRHRFGLITMQERARSMNGDLTILTRLGEGARVTLTIPMDEGYAL